MTDAPTPRMVQWITQKRDAVTIPHDQVPVLDYTAIGDDAVPPMVVNFLRCGCPMVQVSCAHLYEAARAQELYSVIQLSLRALQLPGEKLEASLSKNFLFVITITRRTE